MALNKHFENFQLKEDRGFYWVIIKGIEISFFDLKRIVQVAGVAVRRDEERKVLAHEKTLGYKVESTV